MALVLFVTVRMCGVLQAFHEIRMLEMALSRPVSTEVKYRELVGMGENTVAGGWVW